MEVKLKNTLIEILEHFKFGLDDIEAGSGEYQKMQNEINYALPLLKKIINTPFSEDDLRLAYNQGFNHAKHCAKYQCDDIVNALVKANDQWNNIKWE